ncbi:MAG: DUF1425 domain-containing protein [Phycisphaerales bacterium]
MNSSPLIRSIAAGCLLLGTLGGLAGCNTGTRPPAGVGGDPVGPNYPRVTIDGPLQQYLVIDYPAVVARPPTESQPLAIQVPARSQADNEFSIQYNFTWFDANGIQVGESGWRTSVLPSRRQMMLSGNALSRNAVNWRLDIRSAR